VIVRKSFVANSSSSSFVIFNNSDKDLTVMDLIKENEQSFKDAAMKHYDNNSHKYDGSFEQWYDQMIANSYIDDCIESKGFIVDEVDWQSNQYIDVYIADILYHYHEKITTGSFVTGICSA
jgi:hypothetical protein